MFHGISIISKTMLYRVDVLGEGMEQRKDRLQAGLERVGIHSPAKLLILMEGESPLWGGWWWVVRGVS